MDQAAPDRVALHGSRAAIHDAVAGRPGAFAELEVRLGQLAAQPQPIVAEILVTAINVDALADIVEFAAAHAVRRCRFVAGVEGLPEDQLVELPRLLAAMLAAVARCRAAGIEASVAKLPRCLLDDPTPSSVDPPEGPAGSPSSSCLFEARCELSDACPGLAHPYVARFGWHEQRLQPRPRQRPWQPASAACNAHPQWLALLGATGPGRAHAARVEQIELDRQSLRYHLCTPSAQRVVVELRPRDERAPAFTRSRSFNIAYTRAEGFASPLAVAQLIAPIAAAIVEHDDGQLSLDPREGLAPLDP